MVHTRLRASMTACPLRPRDHLRTADTARIAGLLLWTALAAAILSGWPIAALAERPNVVIIFVDDLGYGELGCQGNAEIPTPHIDSIARAGVRFTDGYVVAPYCSPSRAGLLTGRYPSRFGYEYNPIGAANEEATVGLPATELTLAEYLRDAGYVCALVGKWHLGGHPRYHPLRRGFDEFFGFLHEGHFYVPPPYHGVVTMLRRRTLPNGSHGRWIRSDGRLIYSTHMGYNEPPYDANNPILRGGQPVVEPRYLTDAFTQEAVDFIRRHKDQPFFLYLAYNAVHSPLQAQERYVERFSHIGDIHRRIFAAMLSNLDDGIGMVLDTLRQEGLERKTLVFFLSDNGGPTRELTSSNRPLRGGKGELYEGGIRVPMLAQWPGVIPAGSVYRDPVISLDVFATVAAAVGRPLKGHKLDGVDLLPYLLGRRSGRPHEVLYWRYRRRAAVRVGKWKLVRHPRGNRPGPWELYDLARDIGETRNLAADRPDVVARLRRAWEAIDRQMVPVRAGR